MSGRLAMGLAVLFVALIGRVQAATTLAEWGAVSGTASSTCTSNDCNVTTEAEALQFALGLVLGPVDGGKGAASTSVSTGTWPQPGSVQAGGTVSGDLSVPMLTAGAVSGANQWVGGAALVAQGYEYVGAGETLQLNWGLTGTINNPDNDSLTGLVAVVAFFAGDFQFQSVNNPASALLLYDALEAAAMDGDFLEAYSGSGSLGGGTLDIDVASGDQIYLVMGLMAAAGGENASAESLSTLTASFEGSPPLVQANALVPLPSAFWLFGSGLIGLAGLRRSGRRNIRRH
jgi:hypothetical protein